MQQNLENQSSLDLRNLSVIDCKSIVQPTKRSLFRVAHESVGFSVGDIVCLIYCERKNHLVNLDSYAMMVLDKFNLKLLKDLKLELIEIKDVGYFESHHLLVNYSPEDLPFQNQELNLVNYVTEKFLKFNIQTLKQSKYTKDHVIKFLELLVNKHFLNK